MLYGELQILEFYTLQIVVMSLKIEISTHMITVIFPAIIYSNNRLKLYLVLGDKNRSKNKFKIENTLVGIYTIYGELRMC